MSSADNMTRSGSVEVGVKLANKAKVGDICQLRRRGRPANHRVAIKSRDKY